MKIKIDYDVLDVSLDDDQNTVAMAIACAIEKTEEGIFDLIHREREFLKADKIAEMRRWGRFMQYCHTGRMIE